MGILGRLLRWGWVNLRPCRWITGPEEQKFVRLRTMNTFFHGISDHKARVPTPVVKSVHLCFYSFPLRRFQWPTQVFPYTFPRAFKNGTQSPSSEFQSTWTFHPKLFGTHKGLFSILSKVHDEKQNKLGGANQTNFFLQSPKIPQWQ